MSHRELEQRAAGKFHHKAIFTLNDGSTKVGYMQPFDDEKVYLTGLNGVGLGSIRITDIQSVEFPDN